MAVSAYIRLARVAAILSALVAGAPATPENEPPLRTPPAAASVADYADRSRSLSRLLLELRSSEKNDAVVVLLSGNEDDGRFLANVTWRLFYGVAVEANATRVSVLYGGRLLEDQITRPSPAQDGHKCAIAERMHSRLSSALQWRFKGNLSTPFAVAENVLLRGRKNSKKYLLLLTTEDFSAALNSTLHVKPAGTRKALLSVSSPAGFTEMRLQQLQTADNDSNSVTVITAATRQELEGIVRKSASIDIRGTRYASSPGRCQCSSTTGRCCTPEACHCNLFSGAYECVCSPGFYGDGLNCTACPENTYNADHGVADIQSCIPCPGGTDHESPPGSTSVEACHCKHGFRPSPTSASGCELIRCPRLSSPDHGYFVGKDGERSCDTAVNAACGVRCAAGFEVSGSSVRLCQLNGTWSGTQATCKVKSCQHLRPPRYGGMKCTNPEFTYGTMCEFVCLPGHVIVGSTRRTCLPATMWSGLAARCRSIKCPPLAPVLNGYFIPTNCTQAPQEHGVMCRVACNHGYNLSGISSRQCTSVGSWVSANSTAKCTDEMPPTLVCPPTYQTSTNRREPSSSVAALPQPVQLEDTSGVLLLVLLPSQLEHRFPIGRHLLTYRAEDIWGNKAECTFFVNVLDQEPPMFHVCQSPEPVVTAHRQAWIVLQNPQVSDNSGRPVAIRSTHSSGYFRIGTTRVVYRATDESGNNSTCEVMVTVREDECATSDLVSKGSIECEQQDDVSKLCHLTCHPGYGQAMRGFSTYRCLRGNWLPSQFFDCTKQEPATFEVMLMTKIPSNTGCHNESMVGEILAFVTEQFRQQIQDLCPWKGTLVCNVMYTAYKCSPNAMDGTLTLTAHYKMSIAAAADALQASRPSSDEVVGMLRKAVLILESHYVSHGFTATLSDGLIQTFLFSRLSRSLSCPPGRVMRGALCEPCPRGTFYSVPLQSCTVCPVGSYQDSEGALQCTSCPAGHRTNAAGGKSISACKARCQPGSFSPSGFQDSWASCQTCYHNHYQPEHGQTSCLPCPLHSVTLYRGAESSEECKDPCMMGTVSVSGVEPCFPCPAGSYQDQHGQTYCIGRGSNELPALTITTRTSVENGFGDYPNEIAGSNDYAVPRISENLPNDVVPYSQCFRLPCQNNATCHALDLGFYCECSLGFAGTFCELELDECLSTPCLNGGQCIDLVHDFACLCPLGWGGPTCETEVDECQSSPCLNGGTCFDKPGSYECMCALGYEGVDCREKLEPCASSPCLNNGTCLDHLVNYTCSCSMGYRGTTCDQEIDECMSDPCFNGASCVRLPLPAGGYRCHCQTGFTGPQCDVNVDECESQPCTNNAECIDGVGGYLCNCSAGHGGINCEVVLSSNFQLSFDGSVGQYSTVRLPKKNLTEVTVTAWLRTTDVERAGTVFSYVDAYTDNAFTLTNCNGLTLYVAGESATTEIVVTDGIWHHVAVTWSSDGGRWQLFVDGILVHSGMGLATQQIVKGGGTFVIAQEQDAPAQRFSSMQAFSGSLAYVNGWDYLLSSGEIHAIATGCRKYAGNIVAWAEFALFVTGTVMVDKPVFCGACPRPTVIQHGETLWQATRMGSTVSYVCDLGYQLVGPQLRICQVYSGWAPAAEPICRPISCPPPPAVARSLAKLSGVGRYGDYLHYQCDVGYSTAAHQLLCNASGQWEGNFPTCEEVTCQFESSQHLQAVPQSGSKLYRAGDRLHLQCRTPGKMLNGQSVLTCTGEGRWSHQFPVCSDGADYRCSQVPPTVKNGYYTLRSSAVLAGGVPEVLAVYECVPGYVLVGSNLLACDVEWPTLNATCQPLQCSELLLGPGLLVESRTAAPRIVVKFKCIKGHDMVGSDSIACTNSGQWSNTPPRCQPRNCLKLPEVSNGRVSAQGMVPAGTSVNIYCDNGYTLIGVSELMCQDDGSWSEEVPACYPVTCRTPAPIDNGQTVVENLAYGSAVTYTCNPGYTLIGSTDLYCLADRSWGSRDESIGTPYCQAVRCPLLKPIENGLLVSEMSLVARTVGSNVTYRCFEGYRPSHSMPIVCQTTGEWSTDPPACMRVECPRPARDFPGGGIRDDVLQTVYRFRDQVYYYCQDGYRMHGFASALCQANSTWTTGHPECLLIQCLQPTSPSNGTVVFTTSTYGSSATYQCNRGFFLQGPRKQTCRADGSWEPEGDPACQNIACPEPPPVQNGWHSFAGAAYGAAIAYRCNVGFSLVGNERLTCTENGAWSGPFPYCSEISCAELPSHIANGAVSHNGTGHGSIAVVICDHGFRPVGSTEIECTTTGEWDRPLPRCEAAEGKLLKCNVPPVPANGSVSRSDLAPGSVATYSCNAGYRLVGIPENLCTGSGEWLHSSPPTCDPVTCSPLGPIANGRILHEGGTVSRSKAAYACMPGFVLVSGDLGRTCETDGTWSGHEPVCERVRCYEPLPAVPNGSTSTYDWSQGAQAAVRCDEGFVLLPSAASIVCQEDGHWSNPIEPVCHPLDCGAPPSLASGRVMHNATAYGSVAKYACDGDHILLGPTTLKCGILGGITQWLGIENNSLPACFEVYCNRPGSLPNGRVYGASNATLKSRPGDRLVFVCNVGYELHGGAAVLTCSSTGDWNEPLPSCMLAICPKPIAPLHGYIVSYDSTFRGVVRYKCDEGYALRGRPSRTCLASRDWSGEDPTCEPLQCATPPPVHSGRYTPSLTGYYVGLAVFYRCNKGYRMEGNDMLVCLANRSWSRPRPTCHKQCTPPPVIDNSNQMRDDIGIGKALEFSCRKGYKLTGAAVITCLPGGMWDTEEWPSCVAIVCPMPSNDADLLRHGSKEYAMWGDLLRVPCPEGHYASSTRTIECGEDGKWTSITQAEETDCKPVHCPPPDIANAIVEYGSLMYGSIVRWRCIQGYSPAGHLGGDTTILSLTCQANGSWSEPAAICQLTTCHPIAIDNAILTFSAVVDDAHLYGDTVAVTCHTGYELRGPSEFECRANGIWYPDNLSSCHPVVCQPPPPVIPNGILYSSAPPFSFLAIAIYLCSNENPALRDGEPAITISTCTENGTWSTQPESQCRGSTLVTCPQLTLPVGLLMTGTSLHVGSIAVFHCNDAYQLRGSPAIECRPDGRWSASVPRCEPTECLEPPMIHNGTFTLTHDKIRSRVVYSCPRGYALQGAGAAECPFGGAWNVSESPECLRVDCGKPTVVANAAMSAAADTTYGSTAVYRCHHGYILDGASQTSCSHNGMWLPPPPRCKPVECDLSRMTLVEGGYYHGSDHFYGGAPLVLMCLKGWVLGQGDPLLYCTATGSWSSSAALAPAVCRRVTCPAIAPPANGNAASSGRHYQDKVSFTCAKDYKLVGSEELSCTEIGMWDAPVPECKAKTSCELRGRPRFTDDIPATEYRENDAAVFPCTEGFHGNITMTCRPDGSWSSQKGKCERISCGPPSTDSIGIDKVIGASYVYKAWLVVLCSKGYQRAGDAFITCQSNGSWSQTPKCIRNADLR